MTAADGPLSSIVNALPLALPQAAAADVISSLVSAHAQQQQQPQHGLLAQALLQLQASAHAAPSAGLLALASNAGRPPAFTVPSAPAVTVPGKGAVPDAHSLLANLLGAAAAAGVSIGTRQGRAPVSGPSSGTSELARLLTARLAAPNAAPAAADSGAAGDLLTRLAAAAAEAQLQQQQHQQAAAALQLQQLLAGQHVVPTAIGRQEQRSAVEIFAAVAPAADAAAHDQPQPRASVSEQVPCVNPAAAVATPHDVDPIKALQQTLSHLKANLGLDAVVPTAAGGPQTPAAAGVEVLQPDPKRAKLNGVDAAVAVETVAASGASAKSGGLQLGYAAVQPVAGDAAVDAAEVGAACLASYASAGAAEAAAGDEAVTTADVETGE